MIAPTTPTCECGGRITRHPCANRLPGYVLECWECSTIRVFDGDGREVNLATDGFKRQATIGDKECACVGCSTLSRVKGLCSRHNTRWASIKMPRFGDTYRVWVAAGGPSRSKWEAMK